MSWLNDWLLKADWLRKWLTNELTVWKTDWHANRSTKSLTQLLIQPEMLAVPFEGIVIFPPSYILHCNNLHLIFLSNVWLHSLNTFEYINWDYNNIMHLTTRVKKQYCITKYYVHSVSKYTSCELTLVLDTLILHDGQRESVLLKLRWQTSDMWKLNYLIVFISITGLARLPRSHMKDLVSWRMRTPNPLASL